MEAATRTEKLYQFVAGDEDARVCKDIPDAACADQPRNFFAYLVANLLGKVADEISSAKLVIPWIFSALGVPAVLTGFLVPIREAGKLLPQMAVAAMLRKLPYRKPIWLWGAGLSALALAGMAAAAASLTGVAAGLVILALLIVMSLAEGLCSVSAKDVLGKTVSKSKRGQLMGWSVGISGVAVLVIGLSMSSFDLATVGISVFSGLLVLGGILWIVAAMAFSRILEQPGATEGGGNALSVAARQLGLLARDKPFRRFVTTRALLLSVALAPPFYVLVARQTADTDISGLGLLIIANGLGTSLSAPFWGKLGDRSSRSVMAIGAAGAGLLGIFTFSAVQLQWGWATNALAFAGIFFILNIMHGGLRLGRKVYLVDMATAKTRAAYVAISNTMIGVLMLVGGFIGLLGDILGAPATVLILAIGALVAAVHAWSLPEVSEPA